MRISDWSSDVCSSDLLLRRTRADEFLADHLRADDVDRLPGPAIALGDRPIEIALIDRERAEGADELPKVGPAHIRWRWPVERQKGAHLGAEGLGGLDRKSTRLNSSH